MDKTELEAKTIKELRVIAENLGTRRLNAHTRKEDIIKAILEVSDGKAVNEEQASAKPEKTDDKSVKAEKKPSKSESKPAKATKATPKSAELPSKSEASVKAEEPCDSAKKPASKKAKTTKSKAASIDPDLSALLDALEGKPSKEEESKEAEEAEAEAEKVEEKIETFEEEPAPIEPDSIFIDRGAILPEYLPGTCLFALVRDPGTIFVYWNAEFESERGWLLTAYDKGGNILQQFTTPVRRSGRGYFHVPSSLAARVTLSAISSDGQSDVKLESKIRIAEQLGIAQPDPNDERWVDFKSREVISEAPGNGRAPNAPSYIEQMATPSIAGGGFDRSIENHDHPFGSMSSRFGSLNTPGSSDIFAGSSDSLIRRR